MDPYINFESHVHLTMLTDSAAVPGTKNRAVSQVTFPRHKVIIVKG